MPDWTLVDRIAAYPRGGVLSHLEADGYPASVRVQGRWNPETREVALVAPPFAAAWRGAASLLFHRHDARLEGLAQLLLKGDLVEGDGALVLRVSSVVTANGRSDTDAMPHAGAPLHMLQFYRVGRRAANVYLRKRGGAWPPIPYAQIARRVAEPDLVDPTD